MRNRNHRHVSHPEPDAEGSWAISYGDMVTLLLTFFIIFFTVDKFQIQKSLKLDIYAKQEVQSKELMAKITTTLFPDEAVQDEVQGRVFQAGQRVIVEFSGVSFFKSGEVELGAKAKKALEKFYQAYSPHMGHYRLSIRAFTDPRKVSQNKHRYKDNLELSALRAISVMRFFQTSGVPLSHMTLGGYGEMVRVPASNYDLARTAVLVIEPRELK